MSQMPVASPEHGADTSAPRTTSAVRWLIAINVAIYFIQLTMVTPADVQLALGSQKENLGHQWWTVVTYMFVHRDFWHLALNTSAIWLFGPRVEWQWGTREFVRYYLICGLGGWFAHLALMGGGSVLIGSSAPVLGVMLAYATLWAHERMFLFGAIPTTVRWLVVLVAGGILVDGIAGGGRASGLPYLAHLGGLAAGALYLRTTAAVSLGRLREGVSPVPDEPDDAPPRAVPRSLPRSRARERENIDDVVARSNAAVARRPSSGRTSPDRQIDLAALDKVLDKISAHGIESLSREELNLLDEASRRLRDS
jgi:membrane associated rhomboid family serine protease